MTIAPVHPALVELLWDRLVPHLERVVEVSSGDISLQSIRDKVTRRATDGAMLVVATEGCEILAAVTLEVQELESGKRVLLVPVVAGDRLSDWLEPMLAFATDVARQFGCSELRGGGRRGWLKVLSGVDEGWRETYTVYRRVL